MAEKTTRAKVSLNNNEDTMNHLTLFQTIAYEAVTHESGTAHFYNDTEFFKEFYSLVLEDNSNAIDLGFNIGMQAELMLNFTKGKVFGFEASKKIYDFALDKFKNEDRVELFNCAISNTNGLAEFIDTEVWGAGSLQHTAGMDYCQVGDNFVKTAVELTTLDDVLANEANIDLIKLDIEGAEILAMDGAQQLIKRNKPFMVMEYCHNALSFKFRGESITSTSLYDYAQEIGYKVYNIYGICLSNIEVWNTSILKDTADVFLIPDEQHERWVTELLPVYQYKIYDKILNELLNKPSNFYILTSLPARIYHTINTSSYVDSKRYIKSVHEKLHYYLESRAPIFKTAKLSPRAETLLALIYEDNIEAAYKLGCIKELTEDELIVFQSQLNGVIDWT